jgi:ATP-dependent Lhr-like helicase
MKHLQASSEMFYDVFTEFDPENLLLDQARREVLDNQFEVQRLRAGMEAAARQEVVFVRPDRLTPMSFPIWAETLRQTTLSTEKWADMVRKMVLKLEAVSDRVGQTATQAPRTRKAKSERRGRRAVGR